MLTTENIVKAGKALQVETRRDEKKIQLKIPKDTALKKSLQNKAAAKQKAVLEIKGQNKINVVMQDNTKLLDEVVVTAMGIARKEETLSYSTQTVGGDELTRAKEANLINSLQGKSVT